MDKGVGDSGGGERGECGGGGSGVGRGEGVKGGGEGRPEFSTNWGFFEGRNCLVGGRVLQPGFPILFISDFLICEPVSRVQSVREAR